VEEKTFCVSPVIIAQVSGLLGIGSSMLAMGLSLTVAQIVQPLKNVRLVKIGMIPLYQFPRPNIQSRGFVLFKSERRGTNVLPLIYRQRKIHYSQVSKINSISQPDYREKRISQSLI